MAQSVDVGAHDVFVAKGPDAVLVAAIDEALARLIRVGRYALLFAKYFPGTPSLPKPAPSCGSAWRVALLRREAPSI